MITSDVSLSPFDADELSRILDLIGHLQGGTLSFESLTFNGLKSYYISLENALENDFLHSTCVIGK